MELNKNIMELSQEEKDKLYELINKLSPCIAISSKKNIEQFKQWTKGQVRVFEITDNDNFLCDDKIYLIPVESHSKPIKIIIEGEQNDFTKY